jgi:ectoine hydroxylase-related dioxygenase (phytanoyl-CoA dioxygenase family)
VAIYPMPAYDWLAGDLSKGGTAMPVSPETLPDLAGHYDLSDEQIRAYQRDGHILLPTVCTPEEAAAYRPVIADAVERLKRDYKPMAERSTYDKAFIQVGNLWEEDQAVKRFVLAERFASIAARLMGVSGVRLYHDQALYKEGGGGFTPWHQDQFYWPLDTDKTITMWMPLVDADPQMGTMEFASGSHTDGYLKPVGISDESEDYFDRMVAERGLTINGNDGMTAGDATFHSGWTLHRAPGNNTDRCREVMTVIYYADGTRLLEPDNQNRANDLARWHPGQNPGDAAASPLNPLLYSR